MVIKNYGLSVLDVSIWDITVASFLAGIPFSAIWAFIGTSSKNITEIFNPEAKTSVLDILMKNIPEEYRALCIGVTAISTLLFTYWLISFGKRFREILKEINGKEH